ncbi:hypothetical protein H5410_048524 [Solanum commersonii]|uniref:Uncharacterized protein n=1 Tax=Solanum commersonii TaxID=4109 RepID=A0A9J5XK29_SOLCO|nr:hypothetical protein H5410_048524 [Solanum commersonii]
MLKMLVSHTAQKGWDENGLCREGTYAFLRRAEVEELEIEELKSENVNDFLENRLEDADYAVRARILELLCHREKYNQHSKTFVEDSRNSNIPSKD